MNDYLLRRFFSILKLLVGPLVFGVLIGCATTDAPEEGEPDAESVMPPAVKSVPSARDEKFAVEDYRIGVDDLIQVSVWRNPELSVQVPVRPDGKVSLPLIGDVKVGGRTPTQVAEDIEGKLKRYIRAPQVAVILTELRSHEYLSRVRVTGAVRAPISIPYRQGITVLDAVLEAGGTNEFAAPGRTKVYRKGDKGTEVFKIDLDDIISSGELETNIDLQPGDVVTIPERIF